MKRIPLTKGLFALVDDQDYLPLSRYRWHAKRSEKDTTWYAESRKGKRTILMHRVLIGAKKGQIVDHEDHDGLNNRRSNLKIVTKSENGLNRKDLQSRNKSGVSGVSWAKHLGKWLAQVSYNKKQITIGYFEHLEDAAMATVNWTPDSR